jgi:hypothetical protein
MYLWKAHIDQGAHQYRWVCKDGSFEFGCIAAAMNAAYPWWRKGEKAFVTRVARMYVVMEEFASDGAETKKGPVQDPSGSFPMYLTMEDAQHRIDTMPIHEEVVTRVKGAVFTYCIRSTDFDVDQREVTAAFEQRYEEEASALGTEG